MDGGRALRAIIALWQTRVRATYIAMWVGRVFAGGFVVFGLFGGHILTYLTGETTDYTNPFLAMIGIFVMLGARREYDYEVQRETAEKLILPLRGKTVATYLRQNYTIFLETDSLSKAAETVQNGLEKHFLVGNSENTITGILTYEMLKNSSPHDTVLIEIGALMITDFQVLSNTLDADAAYFLFQNLDLPILPVVDDTNQVVGVLDFEVLHRVVGN